MRRFVVLAIAGWVGLAGIAVKADQTDSRLPPLFDALKSAPDAGVARAFEERIWRIWHQTEDSGSQRLLAEGSAAMHHRRYQLALDRFDKLIEREPEFAEAWNKRATLHYVMGDHAASMRDIERTLKLEPRHFGALSGMAMILMARGLDEAALDAFAQVLEINPYSPAAMVHVDSLRARLDGQPT